MKHPFVSLGGDPMGAFLQTLDRVLYVEDIHAFIHYKYELIGDNDIYKDMDEVYNNNKTFKQGYEHIGQLTIAQHMFYEEFEKLYWTRIILSRIHDDMFWVKEIPIMITNDLIYKIGLKNIGTILVAIKLVKKEVEKLIGS